MKKANSITVNGKNYPAKEIDFNLICDMEEMGVKISDAKKVPTAFVRTYIAICMDADKEDAGKEIQEHMMNGGTLDTVTEVLLSKFESSDFFRNLTKNKGEETTED